MGKLEINFIKIKGSTLIDVLVSLVIINIVVLGFYVVVNLTNRHISDYEVINIVQYDSENRGKQIDDSKQYNSTERKQWRMQSSNKLINECLSIREISYNCYNGIDYTVESYNVRH